VFVNNASSNRFSPASTEVAAYREGRTDPIGILEYSSERREWRVFLPERANMTFLSAGTSTDPSEDDFARGEQYLQDSGFNTATAGWQREGDRWINPGAAAVDRPLTGRMTNASTGPVEAFVVAVSVAPAGRRPAPGRRTG